MTRSARAAVVVLAMAGASGASAQSVHKREAGVVGGGAEMDTGEVDRCRRPGGLSQREIDARVDLHYERGAALYSQGDFESAIDEFVAGYCDGGYASLLYDIGSTFERLARYEKAVAYLERFVSESTDDTDAVKRDIAAFRVRVLRRTPSRITVATAPPGAQVSLLGATGVVARTEANGAELLVARGRYTLRVEMPGYEPIEESIQVSIGRPYSFYFRLEPQRGRLRVFVRPAHARIFVDDRLVGLGTYAEAIPVGEHKITVEAEGRTPETRTIEVLADRASDVRVALSDPPRSGRLELVLASTLAGGVFGGVAFTTIFGEGSSGASFGSLLGLGVGFGGGYLGAPSDVPVGTSSYLVGTSAIAAAEGWLVAAWICDLRSLACGDDTRNASAVFAGALGLGGAAWTAESLRPSAGDAAVVNSGAMWGTTAGALVWQAFAGDDRLGEPLALLGLNLGVAAGITIASRTELGRGHVALIDLGGLVGLVAGAGLGAAVVPDNATDKVRLANFSLGGMTVGLIAGAYLTRNRDDPRPDTRLRAALGTAVDASGHPITTLGAGGTF
jgi:hypothetical protein